MSRNLYGLSECKIHVLSWKMWLRDSSHLPGLIVKKHKFAAACRVKRCRNSEIQPTMNDWVNKIGKTRNVVLYYKAGGNKMLMSCGAQETCRVPGLYFSVCPAAHEAISHPIFEPRKSPNCLKLWDHFSSSSEHHNQQTETEVLFPSTSTAHCFLSACVSACCRQLLIR